MEERNIFIEHKKTILQFARANDVNISVAANMAVQAANEALANKPVTISTDGVDDFLTWVGEVDNLPASEIGSQMAEFNKQSTEAIQRGEPWHL